MNTEDWKKIKQHFEQIVELPLDQQMDACESLDESILIKSEVKKLLDAEAADGEQPGLRTLVLNNAQQMFNSQLELNVGDRIGAYLITDLIGEGGMGVVFKATRDDEQFEHQVAIKLSREKLAYSNVLQQQYEQNILAQLKHPHIAHIYDAGTTADDHAFIIMELIEGVDLLTYANNKRLTIDERLNLFIKVANAIQYAHQKGIIHRDIKPQNILITQVNGEPEPKIIDFGIADHFQASDDELDADKAESPIAILGTPAYMSPEQLEGEQKADARSDIYALGLLLCELVGGEQPYIREGITLDDIKQQKQSGEFSIKELLVHSKQMEFISRERQLSETQLKKHLDIEFDMLIQKATRKSPDNRYASVESFVADIHCWQNNFPLSAIESDWKYSFKKYLQRNRWSVAISFAVLFSLVSATIVSSWSLYKESQALEIAETELAKSNAINRFISDILASADPRKGGANIKVVDLLRDAEEQLFSFDEEQADVKASLLQTLARSRAGLGLHPEAKINFEKSIAIKEQYLPRDSLEMIQLYNEYGEVIIITNIDEALKMYQENLGYAKRQLGELHPETLRTMHNLVSSKYQKGSRDKDNTLLLDAVSEMEKIVELREEVLGEHHEDTAYSRNNLAAFYVFTGDHKRALPYNLKNIDAYHARYGLKNYYTLTSYRSVGYDYFMLGNYDKAEEYLKIAFENLKEIQMLKRPSTLDAGILLIESLLLMNRKQDAIEYAEKLKPVYLNGEMNKMYMEQISKDLFYELYGEPGKTPTNKKSS